MRRFDAARDRAALLALWSASVEAGDMPGAHWAVLTHPAADHDAALAVKRHCGRTGRPFLPLRSSGVSSFLAALASTAPPAEA